jgi:hypothetical protein
MTDDYPYCFQPEAENALNKWLANRNTPAFLLVGPPGIGKTTVVYRIFKKLGYRLCEFNASHTRSGIAFRKTILPLLKYGGVSEWLRDGNSERIAVLLDEMDGLSGGEKGGLQELLSFLRDWAPDDKSHPLILICNRLHGRPMEQIKRISTTVYVNPPQDKQIQLALKDNSKIPPEVLGCGDLRVVFRYLQGFPSLDQRVHIEDTSCTNASLEWAWYCLYTIYDPIMIYNLENNEGNLAGLVIHENIPMRLGSTGHKDYATYRKLFDILHKGDWADFWAFFYQCWEILPLTQQLKLKCTNQIFSNLPPKDEPPNPEDLSFTRVLSRQSALFNAWKEMCRLHDQHNIPIRCVAMVAGEFPDLKSKALKLNMPGYLAPSV